MKTARDIMTENPDCVTPTDTVQRAAQLMRDGDFGALPVVDDTSGRRIIGMITDRDIAIRHVAAGDTERCTVGDHMTRENVVCARPDDGVDQVMSLMEREQVRRIPVVDQDNRLVGMIAQADVAREGPGDREVGDTVEKISEPKGDQNR